MFFLSKDPFWPELSNTLVSSRLAFYESKSLLSYPVTMDIMAKNTSKTTTVGTWSMSDGFVKDNNYEHNSIPRYVKNIKIFCSPQKSLLLHADTFVSELSLQNPGPFTNSMTKGKK